MTHESVPTSQMSDFIDVSKDRINYLWRLFATGVSFFTFGVGGLLLGLVIFPLYFMVFRRTQRIAVARKTIMYVFRFFVHMMRFLGIMTYDVQGFRAINQRGGQLIVANHPTLIDVVFLIAFLDRVDCVVKRTLLNNPVMRGPIVAAQFITNDVGQPEALIQACVDTLNKGGNLIIFPEGTRTKTGQGYVLQRGAANIALRAQVNVTPILIRCDPPTLRKGEKWYKIPRIKGALSLIAQNEIVIAPYLHRPLGVAARQLTEDLTLYFDERCPNDSEL